MMWLSYLSNGKNLKKAVGKSPFENKYDVIVCGLGTAGSIAAMILAEKGYSVLGIEAFNCSGGTASAGGIEVHYFGLPGGRGDALAAEADRLAADLPMPLTEGRKITLEKMMIERGVQICYDTVVVGIYMEENNVVGVQAAGLQGVADLGCRLLFDSTGEGHVARMAGCKGYFGRTADGLTQPFTNLTAVEWNGKILYINLDAGRTDPRDTRVFSNDIIRSRATVPPEVRWSEHMLRYMPLPGIRDGWHLAAEEMLCIEDVFAGYRTAEPGYFSYSDLDKHGEDVAFESELRGEWKVGANIGAWNISVPVPWKTILPETVDGIAVVCRAIGVDNEMASCVRMLPDMYKIAEVAAEAADLALAHGITLREIDYKELAKRLTASGCLHPEHDRGVWIDGKVDFENKILKPHKIEWITEPEKLKLHLAGLTPGIAIWSARQMGERCVPTLLPLLNSTDENIKKHAAFALAAAGSREAVPVLREIVAQRDGTMLCDSRKYNQHRGPMAIFYLGKLKDVESVEMLGEILMDPNESKREIYAPSNRYPSIRGFAVLYFHFVSQSLAALIRIGNAHVELRPRIIEIFEQAFYDGNYVIRLTSRPYYSAEGGYVYNLMRIAEKASALWDKGQTFEF